MTLTKKKSQLLQISPFLTLAAIVAYTWFIFLTTGYMADWRHYILLVLMITNGYLYSRNFRKAIVMSGVILILCSFFLLPPFKEIESAFVYIGPIPIPWIEYRSFLICLAYFIINFHFLIGLYLDWKEKKNIVP